jgi:hypothetical protein
MKRVPLRPPAVDARGAIQNLIDAPFTSAAVVTSGKGAVRGNHFHNTDYHYCWLQRGRMIYYERKAGSSRAPTRRVIRAGQVFYTPPKHEHAMVFTEPSVMLVFARNNRDMKHYEADTVRVASIVPNGR